MRRARRRARAAPEPSGAAGELNIVPFLDIVVNLMLFLLATSAAVMAVAQTEVELPGHGPRGRSPLDLTVIVAERGVLVRTTGGAVAPGCASVSDGWAVTVPRARRAGYDFAALGACLERLHAAHPHERAATLTADPEVAYEDLVAAMDAIRGPPSAPRFTRIRLAAGVR